jgi:hypothetical protein
LRRRGRLANTLQDFAGYDEMIVQRRRPTADLTGWM